MDLRAESPPVSRQHTDVPHVPIAQTHTYHNIPALPTSLPHPTNITLHHMAVRQPQRGNKRPASETASHAPKITKKRRPRQPTVEDSIDELQPQPVPKRPRGRPRLSTISATGANIPNVQMDSNSTFATATDHIGLKPRFAPMAPMAFMAPAVDVGIVDHIWQTPPPSTPNQPQQEFDEQLLYQEPSFQEESILSPPLQEPELQEPKPPVPPKFKRHQYPHPFYVPQEPSGDSKGPGNELTNIRRYFVSETPLPQPPLPFCMAGNGNESLEQMIDRCNTARSLLSSRVLHLNKEEKIMIKYELKETEKEMKKRFGVTWGLVA
ncbi:hypothetical protein EDC01DRAFT_750099 [Geopyxis carbonaria]|nr:hypothetical protein EDC01DRAFT_750099 [Geopyxis carbonaria]